ncbi:phosphotransferase family protein [Gordonia desulfuricans]|uniref:Phosphotransferase family protein n=1 Tax=Gordonia desulfuricans TaxID=89051 RepID=A0A7K3LJ54_9ACTN|nr:phosphotransferase [Gordonia desulfuricans]NDK88296.1 phosphotransferase family protein [Gordonia desulfuricans]
MTHTATDPDLADVLAARVGTALGAPCTVTGLQRVTAGASRATWAFDAATADGRRHALILRHDPSVSDPSGDEPDEMAREAAALTEARRSGVTVPEVLTENSETTGPLAGSYLVMARVEGEALPQRLLRDDAYAAIRPRLPYLMGRELARIHLMEPSAFTDAGAGVNLSFDDPLEEIYGRYVTTMTPRPILDAAFRRLAATRPSTDRITVVHGDFRNGNLLISPDGIEAVLDWELVHLGDPMEDLGWLCCRTWRFGAPDPVGGFGSRDELFRGYTDESGVTPNPDTVAWWELFATVRWAVICQMQADRGDGPGTDNSMELLAIGRRIAECEHDLLELLGWQPYVLHLDDPTGSFPDLFDVPTSADLISAVRDFLRTTASDADPTVAYRTKVAGHILGICAREAELGDTLRAQHRELLHRHGYRDDAELALQIRADAADAADPAIREVITHAIAARLAVANPRHHRSPPRAPTDPGGATRTRRR